MIQKLHAHSNQLHYKTIIKTCSKGVIVFFLSLFLVQCTSVKKHNAKIDKEISVKQLHKDVDFTYRKLQKLQPQLYQYISKTALDAKFDSLKTTITKPLTSYAFFTKLSPVVASIGQGHTFTYPNMKRFTKKESKLLKKQFGPFSQFEFEIFDNKLYVVNNESDLKAIKVGDELTQINNEPVQPLIEEFKNWITSDGYNTTFKDKFIGQRLGTFYTFKNQYQDSIAFEFNHENSYWVKRKAKDSATHTIKTTKEKLTKIQKDSISKVNKRLSKLGYNKLTKKYHRDLSFTAKDSCTAIMKIKSFTVGNYHGFYKESFETLKQTGTQNLIIDLRYNFGGRLNEIEELYSYLAADSTYTFSRPSQVAGKTSMFQMDYFKGSKPLLFTVKALVSPIVYGYLFFRTNKKDDGNYYITSSKEKKAKENKFTGNVYVLINGGSFSASSILSTKLKANKRAVFVGEETGGDYNGTVAGFMPKITLPNSKVKVRLGLMYVNAVEKTEVIGHGIYPDVAISPTIDDRVKDNDPEMNYILETIKTKTTAEITE